MEDKDLYSILGVNRNASDDEIKRAFKSLTKKFHPDRQAGKSDTEKKEAEEKFKEINHAYQVLSDPDKKRNYDQFGSEDGPNNMFEGFGGGFNPFDMFNPFGGHRHNPSKPVERGKDIKMRVSISIEELFNGTTKKLKYNRSVRCVNCHGEGGSGVKVCSHCHGTGMVMEQKSMGANAWSIINSPCPKCHGTGKTVDNKCPTCNGTGLTKESTTVELNIPAGAVHGNIITSHGGGCDARSRKGTSGDLIAVIQYDFIDNDNYDLTVENNKVNVTEHIHIPYYDLLLGYDYTAHIPNGKEKIVSIPKCVEEGTKYTVYNGAVNYNIIIHYAFPKINNEEIISHLKEIKLLSE